MTPVAPPPVLPPPQPLRTSAATHAPSTSLTFTDLPLIRLSTAKLLTILGFFPPSLSATSFHFAEGPWLR
jgi:hypothetical protein